MAPFQCTNLRRIMGMVSLYIEKGVSLKRTLKRFCRARSTLKMVWFQERCSISRRCAEYRERCAVPIFFVLDGPPWTRTDPPQNRIAKRNIFSAPPIWFPGILIFNTKQGERNPTCNPSNLKGCIFLFFLEFWRVARRVAPLPPLWSQSNMFCKLMFWPESENLRTCNIPYK